MVLKEKEIRPEDLKKAQEQAFNNDIKKFQKHLNEFVEVACPACNSSEYVPEFTKYKCQFVTCNKCETLFMNPRPTPEIMDLYYSDSENYQFWVEHIFPASERVRREKIHKPRLERIIRICNEYEIKNGVLLEIGAGFGTFGKLASDSGAFSKVIAIEPTPELAASCRSKGIEVIEKRVENVDDSIEMVDLVVSFEVIEHLYNPVDFINQCGRMIKKGGCLVLTCPNGKGFDIATLKSLSTAVDIEHVNLFNPFSLTGLVEKSGFCVLNVNTPGQLDAELVHHEIVNGNFDVSTQPFLENVLLKNWEKLGEPFQAFLSQHRLSSHMWLVARKV